MLFSCPESQHDFLANLTKRLYIIDSKNKYLLLGLGQFCQAPLMAMLAGTVGQLECLPWPMKK